MVVAAETKKKFRVKYDHLTEIMDNMQITENEALKPKIRKSLSVLASSLNDRISHHMELQKDEGSGSQEPVLNLNLNLDKAKAVQKEILDSTVNRISHIMGKMNAFSAERYLTPPLRPEHVYNKLNGFEVE